jgi:hypothetical protein
MLHKNGLIAHLHGMEEDWQESLIHQEVEAARD